MKTYSELKENIEKTIASINEAQRRIDESTERAFANGINGGYDRTLVDYDAIDELFKLEGVLKRQIQAIYKRYFAERGWDKNDIDNWINYLRREDCGMCWVSEYRDTFKYVY